MARSLLYDVDVHHTWSTDEELIDYAPLEWRDYFRGSGVTPPSLFYSRTGGTVFRLDAVPPTGRTPGSHYETMRTQLLDEHKPERVLLTFGIGREEAYFNPYASAALCSAANDWSLDRWLTNGDDRLYGVLLVPTALPHEAAKEIRRLGDHPRVSGVLMFANPLNRPYGHPIYDPIYEAAVEKDLAVVMHVAGDTMGKAATAAGGVPTTKVEYYALLEQPGMHHLSSLIGSGTFERFPGLRVLFSEFGFTWLPWVLRGLDARYRELKRETPSLRMLPSEYFRKHVWLSTQPFDPPSAESLEALVSGIDGLDEQLCFATDYPHWDCDNPPQVASRLPRSWRPNVMSGNAARLFGWPTEAEAGTRAA